MRTEVKEVFSVGHVIYLPARRLSFFASGINNFARLPILTEQVQDVQDWTSLRATPK